MTQPMNALGLKILENSEGCRLVAYRDGGGIWTIGWGHTGPEVHEGLVWTQAQADAALQQDLERFEAGVTRADGSTPTTANQYSAMCDLAFNIGIGNFLNSSVLRLHKAGNDKGAAAAFALWNKAGGKVEQGLVDRRAAEAALYLTPDGAKTA